MRTRGRQIVTIALLPGGIGLWLTAAQHGFGSRGRLVGSAAILVISAIRPAEHPDGIR